MSVQVHHILVPTDFSPHAEPALEHAIALAREFGARIHLLFAYHLAIDATIPGQTVALQQIRDAVRRASAGRLDDERKRVESAGVGCDARLVAEPPVPAIIEFAREIPADLIVMGTRGLGGLKHVLLGSVAERTVREAPCPVMTVRPGTE